MNQTTTVVLIVLAVAVVFGIRIWRSAREQRWSIRNMWVAPLVFTGLTAVIVGIDVSTSVWVIAAAIVGLAAGIAVGLYQGTHTTVRVDAPSKNVFIKISPIGNLIFITVLVLRIGLRLALAPPNQVAQQTANGGVPALPPEAVIVSAALLALAAGTLIGLRLYVQRIYDAELAAG